MLNSTRLTGSVESYKHRFAKEVLAGWLRDAQQKEGCSCVEACGLAWVSNRGKPYYGVYEEFPIADPVLESGRVCPWDEAILENRIPTFDELVANGTPPYAILDVAILHKGNIVYGFEVVHKNPVSPEKTRFLQSLDCLQVFVISAEWIVSQVCQPKELKYIQKIGGW